MLCNAFPELLAGSFRLKKGEEGEEEEEGKALDSLHSCGGLGEITNEFSHPAHGFPFAIKVSHTPDPHSVYGP